MISDIRKKVNTKERDEKGSPLRRTQSTDFTPSVNTGNKDREDTPSKIVRLAEGTKIGGNASSRSRSPNRQRGGGGGGGSPSQIRLPMRSVGTSPRSPSPFLSRPKEKIKNRLIISHLDYDCLEPAHQHNSSPSNDGDVSPRNALIKQLPLILRSLALKGDKVVEKNEKVMEKRKSDKDKKVGKRRSHNSALRSPRKKKFGLPGFKTKANLKALEYPIGEYSLDNLIKDLSTNINREDDFNSKYEIGDLIGRGGFATIYKAYDKESKRVFAVKKVDFQCLSETEKLQLLVRELLVLHITNHPNLVKMEDAYLHSENLDIVLEYCGFGSLSDLTKGRPLSEEQSIYCLWNTLQGLSVLHSIGICHRDIKGSNILITSEGEVKLSDFGTAARVLPLSRRKTFVGTPYWMPPEVAKSGVSSSLVGYGLSADVWSIGITAIELLMGKPPNSDMLPMSLIYKLASMNTPVPTIPEYLCSDLYNDFVMKCLCNDPDARPSVEDLKDHPVFNEIRKGNPLQSPLLKIERPIKKDQTESKIETIHTLNTLPCDTSDNYWSNWSVTDVASTVDILAAQSGPPRALDVKDSHVSAFIKNAMGEVRGLQRKHQKEQRELTKKCSKQIENTLKNYERWISEGRKMKLAQIQTTIAADTDRLVYIIRAFENPSFVLERKRRKIINKINEFCEFQQPNVLEELKTLYEQIQRRETDFYKEIHVIENNLFALQHKLLIQHLKDMQNEIVANQKKKIDNMYQVLQKFSNETKTLENKDLLLTRAMDHADREFEELKKFQNHEKRDLDDEIAKAKAILDNLHKETERFLKLKEDKLKNVVDTRTSQLNLIETLIDKIIQYSRLHNLEVPFRKGGVCDFSEIFRNEAKHQFEICKLSHRYQKLIDDQKEASERMGRAAAECRSCVYLNELFGIMVSATRKEESDFDIDT